MTEELRLFLLILGGCMVYLGLDLAGYRRLSWLLALSCILAAALLMGLA